MNMLFEIDEVSHQDFDTCCISAIGVELLEGSLYYDDDIVELFTSAEPDAELVAMPRSMGVMVRLPHTDHHRLVALLSRALAEARPFYAGGIADRIPA